MIWLALLLLASVLWVLGLCWAIVEWRRLLAFGRRAAPFALAAWFAYWAWRAIAGVFWDWPVHLDTVGIDGRLYYRAAQTWLAGGDPWTAYTATNTWPPSGQYIHEMFVGPPPTVLAFVPFVWIPETLFVVGWLAVTVAAAVYTIRRLGLPIWWLLFPPMVTGIVSGNPHVVALALLLCGSDRVRWLAAPMKAYAMIPMVAERQWRSLVILGAAGLASVLLFWPLWSHYFAIAGTLQSWLIGAGTHGGYSAARDPRLFVLTAAALAALALVDRRASGWLAVPALWPGTELFYSTFALPLRSPWLTAALALSLPKAAAAIPWVIIAYAVIRLGRWEVDLIKTKRQVTADLRVDRAVAANDDIALPAVWRDPKFIDPRGL